MDDSTEQQNHQRKSVAISKRLAWGAGGMSIVGAFGIMGAFYERFYSREEGLAAERNVARIEQSLDARTSHLTAELKAASAENTRILERKIDRILDFMRDDRLAAAKVNDKQNFDIENLKLLVYSGNKQSLKGVK